MNRPPQKIQFKNVIKFTCNKILPNANLISISKYPKFQKINYVPGIYGYYS